MKAGETTKFLIVVSLAATVFWLEVIMLSSGRAAAKPPIRIYQFAPASQPKALGTGGHHDNIVIHLRCGGGWLVFGEDWDLKPASLLPLPIPKELRP
jgi:hypothetical protein